MKDPSLFPQLMAGLWSENPLVRMRAADAAEKVTRNNPALLQPFKKELLGLMAETTQQELRWHLAAMIPRLALNTAERKLAASLLNGYLEDRSSIVKTFALQGLADLARGDPSMLADRDRDATRGYSQRHTCDEGSQPQIAASFRGRLTRLITVRIACYAQSLNPIGEGP